MVFYSADDPFDLSLRDQSAGIDWQFIGCEDYLTTYQRDIVSNGRPDLSTAIMRPPFWLCQHREMATNDCQEVVPQARFLASYRAANPPLSTASLAAGSIPGRLRALDIADGYTLSLPGNVIS